MDVKKSTSFLAIAFVALLGLSAFASALGVSLGPSRDNPLQIYPGQTLNLPVNLQNAAGTEDVTVRLSISQGGEVASTDEEALYLLSAGSVNNYADVEISAPFRAEVGTQYLVTLSVVTVNDANSAQGISFGSAVEVTFPVVVVERPAGGQPAPSPQMLLTFFVVVLAVLVALWWILRNKKKRK